MSKEYPAIVLPQIPCSLEVVDTWGATALPEIASLVALHLHSSPRPERAGACRRKGGGLYRVFNEVLT